MSSKDVIVIPAKEVHFCEDKSTLCDICKEFKNRKEVEAQLPAPPTLRVKMFENLLSKHLALK